MPNEELIKQNLAHLSTEMGDIKKELKVLAEVLTKNAILEQKLISSNAKHDEGRKVLHKRLDLFGKIAFWLGGTVVTGMSGVIFALVQEIYKG